MNQFTNYLLLFVLLLVLPFYAKSQSTGIEGEAIINAAFNRFWRGNITISSNELSKAIEFCEKAISSPSLSEDARSNLKSKKLVIESFKLYVQLYYEYTLILPNAEIRDILEEKIKDLENNEVTQKDSVMLGALSISKCILYDRLKKYDKSLSNALKAMNLLPEWAYAHSCIGDSYYFLGDYEKSNKHLSESIRLDSTILNNYYILGWTLSSLGRQNEAIVLAEKVLSLNPEFFLAYNLLSKIYGDLKLAEKDTTSLLKLIKINPKWVMAYTNMSYIYRSSGNQNEAKRYSSEAIKQNKYWPKAYQEMGDVYLAMNKVDSSLHYCKKCIEVDPLYAECHIDLGYLYQYYYSDLNQALIHYLDAIKVDSFNSSAYNRTGEVLFIYNRYADAVPYFQRAAELNPNSYALVRLGDSYNQLNDYRSAIKYWDQIIKRNPENKSYKAFAEYAYSGLSVELLNKDSIYDAISLLEKGARLGLRFSKYAALGLRYEHGLNADKDYGLALHYYKKSCEKLVSDRTYFLQHIIKLYEDEKVIMDSIDYNLWKNIEKNGMKKFTIPCIVKKDAPKIPLDVFIQYDYPANVHPMAWEAERLQEEHSAVIPLEVMESFQKLLQLSRKNGVSFLDLCVYALEAANEQKDEESKKHLNTQIDSLRSLIAVSKDESANNYYQQLISLYEKNYKEKKSWYDLKQASGDYTKFGSILFLQKKYLTMADSLFTKALVLDSTNAIAVRYSVLCRSVLGETSAVNSLFKKYGTEIYPKDKSNRTFGDYFYDDLEDYLSENDDNSNLNIIKQIFVSTSVKIRKEFITYEQIKNSRDTVLIKDAFQFYWNTYRVDRKNMNDLTQSIELAEILYNNYKKTNYGSDLIKCYLEVLKQDFNNETIKLKINDVYKNILKISDAAQCKITGGHFWDYWDDEDPNDIKLFAQERVVNLLRISYNANKKDKKNSEDFADKIRYYAIFLNDAKKYELADKIANEGIRVDTSNVKLLLESVSAKIILGKTSEAQSIWRKNVNETYPNKYAKTFGEALIKRLRQYKSSGIINSELEERITKDLKNYIKDRKILIEYDLVSLKDIYRELKISDQVDVSEKLIEYVTNQESFDLYVPSLQSLFNKLTLSGDSEQSLKVANALKSNYDKKNIPLDIRIKCSKIAVEMFGEIYKTFSEDEDVSSEIADACGPYSFALLEFKEFEYGLRVAELAYKANPKEKYVRTNLPLAFLLNNKYNEAESLYIKFAGDKFDKDRTFREVFLDDIEDLKSIGIVHVDFGRIITLLNK